MPLAPLRLLVPTLLVAGGLASAACTRVPVDMAIPDPADARHVFLATPWPSDLLRTADGGLDLAAFPNPYGSSTLEDVIRLFQTAHGYSALSTIYFHVAGGVDEASLPADPRASIADDASLFLLELDGPHAGRRLPAVWKSYPKGTSFLPAGTVAVQPLLGAVAEGKLALVVRSTARANNGDALGASDDMRALLACEDKSVKGVACAPYAAAAATVGTQLGVSVDDLALVVLLTPDDATAGLIAGAEVARALTPTVSGLSIREDNANLPYSIIDGTVELAQFQAGTPPYDVLDGTSGGFVLDTDPDRAGAPLVQRTEQVPFILTVPKSLSQPRDGYCAVINGHGTGGDLESGLGSRSRDEAVEITEAGCAMLAISEPLHRTRAGYREGQEETLTFNFFNPLAGRDNWRQSALEKVQLVTLLQTLEVPNEVSNRGDLHFDAAHIGYFGHSQGGIVGALFVAVEDRVQAVFLSGAGGGFGVSLVEKTDPVVIADVLKLVLGMPDDDDIDLYHPVITLLQAFVDPADPANYGPVWRKKAGAVPHLVASSGLLDTFTPPLCHQALAGAFHLPLVAPVSEELEVLALLDVDDEGASIQGNCHSADGAPLTCGMLQYPDDGHFAVFDNADAQTAYREYFASMRDGVPRTSVLAP